MENEECGVCKMWGMENEEYNKFSADFSTNLGRYTALKPPRPMSSFHRAEVLPLITERYQDRQCTFCGPVFVLVGWWLPAQLTECADI